MERTDPKTTGLLVGAGLGAASAAAIAADLTTVTMHWIAFEPATPADVIQSATGLIKAGYGTLITVASAVVARIMSPR